MAEPSCFPWAWTMRGRGGWGPIVPSEGTPPATWTPPTGHLLKVPPPLRSTTSWDQALNTWGSGDTSDPSRSIPLPQHTVLPTAPALTFDFHFDQFVLRQISQEGNVTVSQAPGTAQPGSCQRFLWTTRGHFITCSLCCGGEIWGHVDFCFVAGNVFSLMF